ncbi:hypothetical protein D4100_06210 [Serratia inhibens]|uniref:KAP NTPase domain-containing protein n=1 Tax=Serratia inhibens TaxID=2338073 RepID=A0AA92X988_9GAMM|nr:hypothetical protein [Serratia inhibens]RJF58345.1 hypothetical protein D4100_06210 [Serratia inhibens]
MSIELIRKSISKFIAHDLPEIMVVKGEWGVGKTYFWNDTLNNANRSGGLVYKKYSYVSLFGMNSLDDLKYSIFENTINKSKVGQNATLDTFLDNAVSNAFYFSKKNAKTLKELPIVKGFMPALDKVSFLSIKETLICIDDLERRGNGLSEVDVLGLISMLKEQRDCKVIILLNESAMEGSELSKYKEKVIDYEVEFKPTTEECIKLAFTDNVNPQVKEYCYRLQIRNIRVLKKIERLSIEIEKYIKECHVKLQKEVVETLVLFMWCYYCSGSDAGVPTLEFVRDKTFDEYGSDKESNKQHDEWNQLLMSLEYYHTNELDLVISNAVTSGFFNEDDLNRALHDKNQDVIRGESGDSFSCAWKKYHNSFTIEKDEVVRAIYDSFMLNGKYVSAANLNGTITLMRNLNENEVATKIIDKYIETHADSPDSFDLDELNYAGDINDSEIISKFKAIHELGKQKETACSVLDRIAGRNGWSPIDIDVLSKTTSAEYFDLFTSDLGDKLIPFVSTCLKFGNFSSNDEAYAKITDNATSALKKIASSSEINRLRVKKFNIKLDD